MKWFKNLHVKTKLLTSFALVIAFAIALSVLAVLTVNRLDDSYSYLLDFPQKRLEYLMQIEKDCSDMRRSTTAITLNLGNPDMIENYSGQFGQAYNNAIDEAAKYIASNNSDTVRDPATLSTNNGIMSDLVKQLESYKEHVDNAVALARTGDFEATNDAFLAGAPIISQAAGSLTDLVSKATSYTVEVSAANTQEKDSSILLFIIVLAAIVVLSIIIALYLAGLISKPMIILTTFMKKAGSTGDITLRPEDVENIEKLSRVKDEIGQCIDSTANFVKHMIEVNKHLEIIANGDLTAELIQLSNDDVMGLSLNKMTANLNAMFNEIKASTAQIATGSKQIADGAQSLAQGSTEQASSIQELSSSINEIADKTKQNAGVAREAADLSSTIRNSAERGSAQMDQMMQAVREINEASKQISKVIKVIDDIAFQTNILALNAAVEAARAGQHGKGFAVVAEEVRNLAAKSAEAAKDTGGLIENSIGKANFGLNIATETSASLKEIVEGINRSAEIVSQIAHSSDGQAGAIAQINTGIDQVAQVIQQNSSTAEESAAASEEMSGQSDVLEQLVSRFKLKDSDHRASLSSGPNFGKEVFTLPEKASLVLSGNDDEEYGKY